MATTTNQRLLRMPGTLGCSTVNFDRSMLSEDELELPLDVQMVLVDLTPEERAIRRLVCKFVDIAQFRSSGVRSQRKAYSRTYPSWDGGRSSSGRRYSQSWGRLLEKCKQLGVTPASYVFFRYSTWTRPMLITPNDLISEQHIRRFAVDAKRNVEALQVDLKAQNAMALKLFYSAMRMSKMLCISDTDSHYAHNAVIYHKALPMTPLFCYCYAIRVGNTQAVGKLRASAIVQYLLDRVGYDTAWSDLIPKDLRDLSDDELITSMENTEYVPTRLSTISSAVPGN